MLDNKLVNDEIPNDIKLELTENFNSVVYDLDSDITTNTKTFKCKYAEVDSMLTEGDVIDPKTFETISITGYATVTFFVRVDEDRDHNAIVRAVLKSGPVVVPSQ